MAQYLAPHLAALEPYVPGEQPQDMQYVKLNTNESPYPPAPGVIEAINAEEAARLNLYSDPTARLATEALAARLGVGKEQVMLTNGSDEALALAFYGYGQQGVNCPDISYGFYPVFARLYNLPYHAIALDENFCIRPQDYQNLTGAVVIANPNAQTGIPLPLAQVEEIVAQNPQGMVIVDEAYVDFYGHSAVALIDRYENLLVIGTFSKSRNLAGARIGYAVGQRARIAELQTLRNSFNPYNLNRLSLLAAVQSVQDDAYFRACVQKICQTRTFTLQQLQARGFECTPSGANFILARTPQMSGEALYLALKQRGVLVRHFPDARICDYVRITIGTQAQMQCVLDAIDTILAEVCHA